jgi:hypothetical protein
MSEQYVIEARCGPVFGEEVIRSIEVPFSEAQADLTVLELVESYRDYYASRNGVVWEGREIDAQGVLAGLAPDGISYRIVVTPPLPVEADAPTQPTLW